MSKSQVCLAERWLNMLAMVVFTIAIRTGKGVPAWLPRREHRGSIFMSAEARQNPHPEPRRVRHPRFLVSQLARVNQCYAPLENVHHIQGCATRPGWHISKALPGLGTALNVFSTGQDLYSVLKDYRSCMAAPTN